MLAVEGLDAAFDRAAAYRDAGADILFRSAAVIRRDEKYNCHFWK